MADLPKRKTIRLPHYDYRSKGAYHVTICAKNHACIFGRIEQGVVQLNELGMIADKNIAAIPEHFTDVDVIEYVVMPNHVHLLLALGLNADAIYGVPTANNSVGQVIGAYKASVTRAWGKAIWQSRYYEHIIRNEQDLLETVTYIQNNPKAWDKDELNKPDMPF